MVLRPSGALVNKYNVQINENLTVSWEDIFSLHILDQEDMKSSLLTKITQGHVSPSNFDKMKVK